MRLTIRCALCMEKEQLGFNFWYCALWTRKYGNYSQTSFIRTTLFRQNVGLARYPENRNQTCSQGGIRGQSSINFLCFSKFSLPSSFSLSSSSRTLICLAWKHYQLVQVLNSNLNSEWVYWKKFKRKEIISKNTNRTLRDTNADRKTVLLSHLRNNYAFIAEYCW